jgi:hypothetical protein
MDGGYIGGTTSNWQAGPNGPNLMTVDNTIRVSGTLFGGGSGSGSGGGSISGGTAAFNIAQSTIVGNVWIKL